MKKHTFVLLLLLAGFIRPGFGQAIDPALATRLQIVIDSIRAAESIKGISACVILPGQGKWYGVSGESHPGVPIHTQMEFGIGSNTKLFTGALLLKLIDENFLEINDSLHQYLPPLNNVDSNITIRQLLHQTSGLADINTIPGFPDSVLLNPTRLFSPNETSTWIEAPLYSAGMGWNYSNTNYLLAGMIAESATGQAYHTLLRNKIFSPLQLDSIFLGAYDSIPLDIAHPWSGTTDNYSIPRVALNSIAWSAGAMYATAGDMARWYESLIGGQLLSPVGFQEMTTFVGTGNYGVGLIQTQVNGRTVWQHGGSIWGGYNSSMMYDTATGIIISVLVNQNPGQAFLIAGQLLSNITDYPLVIGDIQRVEQKMLLYPNPSEEEIFVRAGSQKILRVHVYGIHGEYMGSYLHSTIPCGNFTPGVYMISAETEEGSIKGRFIKE